jgi:hypothetical protein
MFASFFPKFPRVWAIQASLLSDCFWPNVAGMQKCLLAAVQKPLMLPQYKKKRTVAHALCDEEANVDNVVLEGPSFSAFHVVVVVKERKD